MTTLPRTPDSAFSRKLANSPDFNSEKRSINSPSLTVRFPSTSALSKTAPIASAQGRQAGRGGPRPRRGRGPPRRNPDNPGPRPGFWIGEPRQPRTPAGVLDRRTPTTPNPGRGRPVPRLEKRQSSVFVFLLIFYVSFDIGIFNCFFLSYRVSSHPRRREKHTVTCHHHGRLRRSRASRSSRSSGFVTAEFYAQKPAVNVPSSFLDSCSMICVGAWAPKSSLLSLR